MSQDESKSQDLVTALEANKQTEAFMPPTRHNVYVLPLSPFTNPQSPETMVV
jgi:hypothetical protein